MDVLLVFAENMFDPYPADAQITIPAKFGGLLYEDQVVIPIGVR